MSWLLANWKANFNLSQFSELVAKVPEGSDKVGIFPPFPYLWPISKILPHGVQLGSQDISCFEAGAHTGEVVQNMLSELTVAQVLIGHSERRADVDSNSRVGLKLKRVVEGGMLPVVCCGAHDQQVNDKLIANSLNF